MTDKLYIIGNGFDLHHELRTSYADFRNDYVRKVPSLWNALLDIYDDVEITFIEDDGEISIKNFDNLMINTSLSRGNEDLREENAVVDSVRMNYERDKVIKNKIENLSPEEKKKLLENL